MANETEYANFITVAAYVAANAAPYFRSASVVRPHIIVEAPNPGSNAKKFKTKGNLTMAVTAESAPATKVEYTESSTTLTLQKGVTYVELSHEAQAYQAEDKLLELTEEAGTAAAQLLDTELMKLFDGFSNSVGSTGVDLTPQVFMSAAYTADLNNSPAPLVAFLHPTQLHDVQDDIIAPTTANNIYSTGTNMSVTSGQPNPTGFRGMLFDIPIYRSTNTESINAGADWSGAVLSKWALAALVRDQLTVNVGKNIQNSLHELAVILDFQVGEFVDAAGCGIVSDQ